MTQEIRWTTYEYHHTEKSAEWFWVFAILSFSFVVLAILFREFLLALLILSASITLGLISNKPPKLISVGFNDSGFLHDEIFYPYKMISKFWIRTESLMNPELYLKTSSIWHPYIMVTIPQNRLEEIRTLLKEKVQTEEEFYEPIVYQLFDTLGF